MNWIGRCSGYEGAERSNTLLASLLQGLGGGKGGGWPTDL